MKLSYAVIRPTQEDEYLDVELVFKEVEGESSLEILQQEVGGYIEHLTWYFPWAGQEGIDAWGNDEAALLNLPVTCAVLSFNRFYAEPVAWLRGNIVFTRFTEDGDTISLTEDDKKLIADKFYWSTGLKTDDPDHPEQWMKPFVQEF